MTTHRSETDRLCGRAAALCRRIAARELAGVPLYIVPQTRLPHELGGASVCGGYTSPSLDLHLQEHIPVCAAALGRGDSGELAIAQAGDGQRPVAGVFARRQAVGRLRHLVQ